MKERLLFAIIVAPFFSLLICIGSLILDVLTKRR